MDRIQIHTNFTATASKIYDIPLAELDTPRNIEIMRWLFHEPEKLRPDATSEAITTEVAERLGLVAQGLASARLRPDGRGPFHGPHCVLSVRGGRGAAAASTVQQGRGEVARP